ncbi:MAG: DNA-binding response regulator [Planctomycetota bacterium]|nr:MAG: DNA-binding response regulator [Planctomycetota bacterium]
MSMTEHNTIDKTARILIVDDHPTVCEGLSHRIAAQPELTVCGQAADVGEALQKIDELDPDLAIVDIALHSSDGLDLVKAIKARRKRVRALVHSMYDEEIYADRCLHAGAMGYVNKGADPDEVIKAIRVILAGQVYLSPTMTSQVLTRTIGRVETETDPVEMLTDRQLEIFRLIGNGYSAQQIAKRLHISVHTVETHRENIKRKLNVETVSQLARRAVLWAAENC